MNGDEDDETGPRGVKSHEVMNTELGTSLGSRPGERGA